MRFGTSGWRAIISDEFTFDNVRLVTQAIADYVKKTKKKSPPKIIVGYDTRLMSEKFAGISAEVLASNNIKVLLTDRDVPTPVISYEILKRGLDGGINFTASHNPAEYNGMKFSPGWGGPALPETTQAIEKNSEYYEFMSNEIRPLAPELPYIYKWLVFLTFSIPYGGFKILK